MKTSLLAVVLIVASVCVASRDARAQASGFAVDRYEPSDRGSDWFANESLDFRGAHPAAGAVFDWAYKPLVLYPRDDVQGLARAQIITDQIFVHVGGSFMVADRVRVALNLPIALYQNGDGPDGVAIAARTPDKAALGDTRLACDALLFGGNDGVLRGAIGAQLFLPTGSRALFTGDGTLRVAPRFLLAGDVGAFVYAAKLGFMYRPFDSAFEGRPLGSELLFSTAIGLKANNRFVFGPEFYGSTAVSGEPIFRTRNTPLELLFGSRLTLGKHYQVGTAIGPGLTRGDGSPSMRVVVSIEYAPPPPNDTEKKHD